MEIGTSLGLALSSGINAYLPLLAFSVAVRWLHLYKVNPTFEYITSDWFIIILVVLTIADFVADKIPYVDHIWDAIHTVLRPMAGAVVAAASSNEISGVGLTIPLVLGAGAAGITHVTKASTRAASTASTGGFLNTILSILEDIAMIIGVVLSFVAPVLMIVLAVVFILIFAFTAPRVVRAFKRRLQRPKATATTL
jgi:hypothetical protein